MGVARVRPHRAPADAVEVVTPPPLLPVSLEDAKDFARVDETTDDSVVLALISSATAEIERRIGRSLIQRTLRAWLHGFPGPSPEQEPWWNGVQDGHIGTLLSSDRPIELPFGPLASVSSIKWYDSTGAATTVSPSDYYVIASADLVAPVSTWPTVVTRDHAGVSIEYVAGWGTGAEAVPADLRRAILSLVAFHYDNRGDGDEPSNIARAVQRHRVTLMR